MSPTEVVVRGVLKPDGTLELTEKPALQEGPVEVTIRPAGAGAPSKEGWYDYLVTAWMEWQASGRHSRTRGEIDAELRAAREADAERDRRIEQLQDECRREREGGGHDLP